MPKKYRIAVLPGDGIGRIVTDEATKIFQQLSCSIELIRGDIGWDYWCNEGTPIPKRTWELIDSCDTALLGAITSKPEREAETELLEALKNHDLSYISPIVQLRQHLDLFANVRPCANFFGAQENFNIVVIRENTEGLYSGLDFYPAPSDLMSRVHSKKRWNKLSGKDVACSLRVQTRQGLVRLFKYAFTYAKKYGYRRVTLADKPNVLRQSSTLVRDVFESVASEYSNINADIHNVDAVALWMVKRPESFGVIVCENMFGDILSDLGAGIMGGLGLAPSANIGSKASYFEPVHGSGPNVMEQFANPMAMFLTIGLLLEQLQYFVEAEAIRNSVKHAIQLHRYVTPDLGGKAKTKEVAEHIIELYMKETN